MAFWRKRYTSKHTGKEIDDAVDAVGQLPENIISNPMTAAGDLIVGGEDGAAGKLAAGTSGQVLKIGASGPEWSSDAEGMANPMTAAGDIIVGGADGAPGRLAKGTAGQVLKMNAGATAPEWASDAEGMANPMNDAGDLIIGGTDGEPTALPAGTAGQVLTMNAGATAPEWQTPSGGQLYHHSIVMQLNINNNAYKGFISFNLVDDNPTAYTKNDIDTIMTKYNRISCSVVYRTDPNGTAFGYEIAKTDNPTQHYFAIVYTKVTYTTDGTNVAINYGYGVESIFRTSGNYQTTVQTLTDTVTTI